MGRGRGRGTGEGGVSQGQVAGLHSQIDSQNQRILMVMNLYGREERRKGAVDQDQVAGLHLQKHFIPLGEWISCMYDAHQHLNHVYFYLGCILL